jgi:hypothetical protein
MAFFYGLSKIFSGVGGSADIGSPPDSPIGAYIGVCIGVYIGACIGACIRAVSQSHRGCIAAPSGLYIGVYCIGVAIGPVSVGK